MNIKTAFVAVLLMALVTYLPRVLPLAVFRREIKSKYIKSFLKYVPFAVLGALTFPDIFYSTGTMSTAVCGTIVALFLAYREKSLVVVAIGAILTVYITGFIFR
jgi:branched-subunit amino acid transport protein